MVAVPSYLDPARMGSMGTRSTSGSLSVIPIYAHDCGGDISDEFLPSRPEMCVCYLSYLTVVSPQLTPMSS